MPTAFIAFRGKDREVEYAYEFDPASGIDGVYEWTFNGDFTAEPTDAEYEEIAQVLTILHQQRADDDPEAV